MIGNGMSSQGAFAASSGGESASGGESSSGNSSSGKSSGKVISSVSTSYSQTSYGGEYSGTSTGKSSPHTVNVSFNKQATEMAWVARGGDSLKDTTRHLIANKNEKQQTLYAHAENGNVIMDRMANKAHQGLHYDLMRDTSFNRTHQHNQFANMHAIQNEQLQVKFDQRQQRIRDCGITLSHSFKQRTAAKSQSPTPAPAQTRQREARPNSIPPHMRGNDRERGR